MVTATWGCVTTVVWPPAVTGAVLGAVADGRVAVGVLWCACDTGVVVRVGDAVGAARLDAGRGVRGVVDGAGALEARSTRGALLAARAGLDAAVAGWGAACGDAAGRG